MSAQRNVRDRTGRLSGRKRRRRRNYRPLTVLVIFLLICSSFILFKRLAMLTETAQELSFRLEELENASAAQQEKLALYEQSAARLQEELTASAVSEPQWQYTEQTSAAADNQEEITAAHKVYLTFDDGPSKYTEEILEILERYQVRATFFVIGKEDAGTEDRLRKIIEGGHTLGLHSYSHDYKQLYQSVESFADDLKKQQDYIYQVTGCKSRYYRFPGGSSNTISQIDMQVFAKYLHEQDMEFYDWSISAGDGGSVELDVDTLVENCTRDIQSRGTTIVLMHDSQDKYSTVKALPAIIEKIQAMEDTVLLPITDSTVPVWHIKMDAGE